MFHYLGSSAEKAGLRPTKKTWRRIEYGDIIQAVDGREVQTVEDFLSAIDDKSVGDTVTLRVLRANESEPVDIKVKLEEQ